MTKYELYTEDKHEPLIRAILNKYVNGYTLIHATGCWNGTQEPALVIVILAETAETVTDIDRIVHDICAFNAQTSVLVVSTPVTGQFVTPQPAERAPS